MTTLRAPLCLAGLAGCCLWLSAEQTKSANVDLLRGVGGGLLAMAIIVQHRPARLFLARSTRVMLVLALATVKLVSLARAESTLIVGGAAVGLILGSMLVRVFDQSLAREMDAEGGNAQTRIQQSIRAKADAARRARGAKPTADAIPPKIDDLGPGAPPTSP